MGYDYVHAYNQNGNKIQRRSQTAAVGGGSESPAQKGQSTPSYKKISASEALSGQHSLKDATSMSYRNTGEGLKFAAKKTGDSFELQGDSKLSGKFGDGEQYKDGWDDPKDASLVTANKGEKFNASSFITQTQDGSSSSVSDKNEYHTNFALKDKDGGMKVYESDTKNASTAADAKQQRQDAVDEIFNGDKDSTFGKLSEQIKAAGGDNKDDMQGKLDAIKDSLYENKGGELVQKENLSNEDIKNLMSNMQGLNDKIEGNSDEGSDLQKLNDELAQKVAKVISEAEDEIAGDDPVETETADKQALYHHTARPA